MTEQHEGMPMLLPITLDAVVADPSLASSTVEWRGETITFRPLEPDDVGRLASYFEALSPATRDVFGPHPFTHEQARLLCAGNGLHGTLLMVGVREGAEGRPVVAYYLLSFALPDDDLCRYASYGIALDGTTCRVGPSVADALRGQGLATALMPEVESIVRLLGCARIILLGGVFTTNVQAIRFYERVGFRGLGTFKLGGRESCDMMMELPD